MCRNAERIIRLAAQERPVGRPDGSLIAAGPSRTALSPLLMTGILGGFTTFSAFSLDTLKLIQTGQAPQAAAYVLGSVALSLAATALGVALAKFRGTSVEDRYDACHSVAE